MIFILRYKCQIHCQIGDLLALFALKLDILVSKLIRPDKTRIITFK